MKIIQLERALGSPLKSVENSQNVHDKLAAYFNTRSELLGVSVQPCREEKR